MTSRRNGAFIDDVPILALAVVAIVAWLVVRRGRPIPPFARVAGAACVVVAAAVVALRAGPLGTAVAVAAAVTLGLWLGHRKRDDDGGDDGTDPPDPVDPPAGPGSRVKLIDPEAFDRARAEWDREPQRRR